ncbi:D-cysteine desulfhydrase family protein [Aestuariibacter sp. A3R04]|uniref:D-cysteine desulfhydrase family protein n=1 Tax=Aestuariibacter sp. A3R04 TaxID=2841571 RepID=UPI001C094F7C|nr:D-cysteine desulfhydrase family protein [Aestuariibacter sp. A3R04]MBU3020830.1 D-cysteine desulfhydrase family protein [Aestuariibacter sp. A3R04]
MQLSELPRTSLAFLPTPLSAISRFAGEIGAPASSLLIKRDDCTGLAQGGNKTRKLEFILGDALKKGATSVITVGALQSNHVRQTAAACASLGLECDVVLTTSVPRTLDVYKHNGNLLLNAFLGATIHRVDNTAMQQQKVTELIEHKARQGKRPYFIPTGGSNAIGALGYANAVEELAQQCDAFLGRGRCFIFHASASGGTQAGLVVGNAILGNPFKVIGVNVYKPDRAAVLDNVKSIVDEMISTFSLSLQAKPDFELVQGFQGEAYGIPTQEGNEALQLMARSEGILVDPVYSAKALAAVVTGFRRGDFETSDKVIFLHTGGATALHAYPDTLQPV